MNHYNLVVKYETYETYEMMDFEWEKPRIHYPMEMDWEPCQPEYLAIRCWLGFSVLKSPVLRHPTESNEPFTATDGEARAGGNSLGREKTEEELELDAMFDWEEIS